MRLAEYIWQNSSRVMPETCELPNHEFLAKLTVLGKFPPTLSKNLPVMEFASTQTESSDDPEEYFKPEHHPGKVLSAERILKIYKLLYLYRSQ